jgi:hypothetical protein
MASLHIVHKDDDDTDIAKMLGKDLKRGDVISTSVGGYRNSCVKGIWNGRRTVQLEDFPDDYGTVPREFEISDTEFSPSHWLDVIDHNNYVWFTADIRKRIVECLQGQSEFLEISGWRWKFDYYVELTDEFYKRILNDECYYAMTSTKTIAIYVE